MASHRTAPGEAGKGQVVHCDHGWEWGYRSPGSAWRPGGCIFFTRIQRETALGCGLDKLQFEPRPTRPRIFALSIEPNGTLQASPVLESQHAILSPLCSLGSLRSGSASMPPSCSSCRWPGCGQRWLCGPLLPTQLTFNLSSQDSLILMFNLRRLSKYFLQETKHVPPWK